MFRKSCYIFFTVLISLFSCQNESQLKNISGGFRDLPCDESLNNLDLESSPFSMDSIMKIEFYNNQDSISRFKLLKSMYYSLNMENCEVNKNEINFNLLVVYKNSKQQYHITVKKLKTGKFKVIDKILIDKNKMQHIN